MGGRRSILEAPGFILEVLPQPTKKKDSVIRLNKCLNEGCGIF